MEYMEETALQKEPEITVLKVEPGKAPEEVTIPNTLEAMQQMVGGLIEIVYLDGVCLVCNEEGKLMGLEGNRRVGRDIISGTFFLAGDTDYGEFCSLTQEQLNQFSQRFAQPETFRPGTGAAGCPPVFSAEAAEGLAPEGTGASPGGAV